MRSLALARLLHKPSVEHLTRLLQAHTPLDQAAACLNLSPSSLLDILNEQSNLEADPHVASRAVHDEQSEDAERLRTLEWHHEPSPPLLSAPERAEGPAVSDAADSGPPGAGPPKSRFHPPPPENPFRATDQRQTRAWQDAIKHLLSTTPDLPEDLLIAIRTYAPSDPILSKAARMLPGVGWHEDRVYAQSQLPDEISDLPFELQVVLLKNIRKVERARAEAQAELTKLLAKEAKDGNMRAITFLLERSDPRNWAPTSPRPATNPNATSRTPKPVIAGTVVAPVLSAKAEKLVETIRGLSEEDIRTRVEDLLRR